MKKYREKLVMVVHIYTQSTWESEAGGLLQVPCHLELQSEYQANQDCITNFFLKNKN